MVFPWNKPSSELGVSPFMEPRSAAWNTPPSKRWPPSQAFDALEKSRGGARESWVGIPEHEDWWWSWSMDDTRIYTYMYILYYIIYYIMIHVGYCDYHCQSINNDNMNIIYYHLFCNFLLSTSDSVFVSMNSTDSQKLYESLILRSHPVVVRGCVLLPWKMTDCFHIFSSINWASPNLFLPHIKKLTAHRTDFLPRFYLQTSNHPDPRDFPLYELYNII